MSIKVGIPGGLFYFKFISLWETFFKCLGVEIVVSEPTNKRILENGVKACVDEACVPVKLFHGHVINLKDKVDYIFIPRFTSISKREYICPEFGGLPDMVRHTLPGLPPLIDTEINMYKSNRGAIKAAVETAARLGIGEKAAKTALEAALIDYRRFRERELNGELQFCRTNNGPGSRNNGEVSSIKPKIALIGHSYNIYDEYISMNIISKLNKFGYDVVTVEMVDEEHINKCTSLLTKPMFWNYGRKAFGAAIHLAGAEKIEGMVCVSSFGCGIDSMVCDLIERKIRKYYHIPFINFTMDEHSGEAGFNTRLEAFIDMLQWRKHNEDNISALR